MDLLGGVCSSAANRLTNNMLWISLCSTAQTTVIGYVMIIQQHPDHRDSSILFLGNPRGLKIRLIFGNELRHHCLLYRHGLNATSYIRNSSVPFLSVWNCHFHMMKSCSVEKNIVSSGSDHFYCVGQGKPSRDLGSADGWCSKKATADFREASERRPATSSQTNRVSKLFSNRSPVQKRRSIYNWNPGPRRGKEDAFEKQIAGQVACHCLAGGIWVCRSWHSFRSVPRDHAGLRDSLQWGHLLSQHRCQVHLPSWHKTRLARSSHGRRTRMGSARCSFTCLISSCRSQRSKVLCCVVATYQQHLRQEERHHQEAHSHSSCHKDFSKVDLVAGEFNGTAWRCSNRDNISATDEAFTDCALPTATGSTPLWGPGSIPDNWADLCGFLKPPCSDRFWKANKLGALSIPRRTLGLRPADQSCHHETWLHLDFVDWSNTWSRKDDYEKAHFSQRTTCRLFIRDPKSDVLAKLWATIRSRRNCATIRTRWSIFCETSLEACRSMNYLLFK